MEEPNQTLKLVAGYIRPKYILHCLSWELSKDPSLLNGLVKHRDGNSGLHCIEDLGLQWKEEFGKFVPFLYTTFRLNFE